MDYGILVNKEYLISEHVDLEEDLSYFENALNKQGLLISESEVSDEFPGEPTGDDIEEMDDEE